jgi:hypothetical protein
MEIMETFTITPKGMIRDILSQINFAYQLKNKGKDYDALLSVLLSYEDRDGYPTINELTKKLAVSYSVFKRLVSELYDDLCNIYENGIDYSITKNQYIFSLNWLGSYAQVKLQNLPVCPRVGETVQLPFFREKVGTDNFFVKSIIHYFSDEIQTIYFHLAVGQYNVFWNHFRDEEYARGRMKPDEYSELSESKIRGKYGFRWI